MQDALRSRVKGWARKPPTGLAGAAFWLALWFCVLLVLHLLPGGWGIFFGVTEIFVGVALVAVAVPLIWQIVRRRMLWSLRNKLVLTYLLIGLAPVVLVVTLVLISSYIAAGQFAIHLVDSRLQAELSQMDGANAHRADVIAQVLGGKPSAQEMEEQDSAVNRLDESKIRLHPSTKAYINGAPIALDQISEKTPLGLPPWASELKGRDFQNLVLDGGDLYLVVVHQRRLGDGRMFSLVSSMPVDKGLMNLIADGLGRAMLFPESLGNLAEERRVEEAAEKRPASALVMPSRRGLKNTDGIAGGNEPPAVNALDIRVRFLSTTSITDWGSGDRDSILIEVDSRPTLLYKRLFGASLGGVITTGIRDGLIVLCIVFALIELLALYMAIRLSRTITASVADLYEATHAVDRGELSHRIGVNRSDQLAELSRSFNTMTGSLQRLLQEQKEKERLQNEISIAQEVQANLFPHHISNLASLELHGVCRPARSVSGDYYDFLVFHQEANEGVPSRRETGVGIAIGDISGKGISAALLMATLHSAVRAYRFASEELIYSETSWAGLMASREERGGDCDELFESPGRILSLLNRHLYRSTQPEKYATLFLAHYDAASAMLTYSNAGQLPPLVLGRDGAIRRLDQGGTVVGLMDGMHYEEDRFQMRPGDIMVAYSDGVTEPENDFGEFGEERLMDVVRRYRDEPLHVISTKVMQALDAWIGAEEQPDDITLVLARQT
ncbi:MULTISPECIES: PP2C family protein-serine/threonine phosphatase [Acidobacteriaceae]|uniref:PP2C family protein-serine/threonine phosphatase n=1 Tax=Acidobacteriaceae TaxID=204434 RepID=UPI0020B132B7|nr:MULTISPECIES: PP2C family protein-serine/threonine phosphatase [Acidobacteriaceae]MDW5265486.1 PP2C family protein-serine/threonine phosphatase [Edaphobacter sp.]